MRILPTLLLSCFAVVVVQAQAQYLGIRGGGWPGQVQISGNLFYDYPINTQWSIRSSVGYIRRQNQSLTIRFPVSGEGEYYDAVVSYADFRVQLRGKLDLEVLRFYALLGPSFGYGLGLQGYYREPLNRFETVNFDFQEQGLRKVDLGVDLGLGFEREITQGRIIFMEVSYYLGLLDIDSDTQRSIYNQGLLGNLGFKIPLPATAKK